MKLCVYSYRCARCGWRGEKRAAGDPGSVPCPECGDGKPIEWGMKRPEAKFISPIVPGTVFGDVSGDPEDRWYNPNALHRTDKAPFRREIDRQDRAIDREAAVEQARAKERGQLELPGVDTKTDAIDPLGGDST